MSMQVTKVWWDGEKLMAEPISKSDVYKPEPKRPQNCGTTYCSCIECVMEQPAQPQQGCHSNSAESEEQNSLTLMDDMQAQPQQESVMYDKTEMNFFAQNLYDQKMREGKRGHYESMFHVIHQCIKKVAPAQPQQEPVAYRSRWRNTEGQIITGWVAHTETTANPDPRLEIEPLYTSPLASKPLTDEVTDRCIEAADTRWADAFVPVQWARHFKNAIEAAHGIKGDA